MFKGGRSVSELNIGEGDLGEAAEKKALQGNPVMSPCALVITKTGGRVNRLKDRCAKRARFLADGTGKKETEKGKGKKNGGVESLIRKE